MGTTGFVLVHGGYHGAWAWERLIPHLDAPTLAVDLPGRGTRPRALDDVTVAVCADSVAADVDEAGFDRVVLVGHSLAGVLLPEIGARLGDRLTHLVFVASLVAADGRSSIDSMPADLAARARVRLRALGGASSEIDVEHHREQLCNDMDEEQTAFTLARLVPDSLNLFEDPVSWAGIDPGVPRTYVRLLRDQALAPAMQDVMIGLLGPDVAVPQLDTGHNVMITQPDLLASILNPLASGERPAP